MDIDLDADTHTHTHTHTHTCDAYTKTYRYSSYVCALYVCLICTGIGLRVCLISVCLICTKESLTSMPYMCALYVQG
jgi:hypothetical protein